MDKDGPDWFWKLVAFLVALWVAPCSAGWFGPDNYAECIEKYVPVAESNKAALALNSSCELEFQREFKTKKWLKYYDCLRDNLPGVKVDKAAVVIWQSCRDKYPGLFRKDHRGFSVPVAP